MQSYILILAHTHTKHNNDNAEKKTESPTKLCSNSSNMNIESLSPSFIPIQCLSLSMGFPVSQFSLSSLKLSNVNNSNFYCKYLDTDSDVMMVFHFVHINLCRSYQVHDGVRFGYIRLARWLAGRFTIRFSSVITILPRLFDFAFTMFKLHKLNGAITENGKKKVYTHTHRTLVRDVWCKYRFDEWKATREMEMNKRKRKGQSEEEIHSKNSREIRTFQLEFGKRRRNKKAASETRKTISFNTCIEALYSQINFKCVFNDRNMPKSVVIGSIKKEFKT